MRTLLAIFIAIVSMSFAHANPEEPLPRLEGLSVAIDIGHNEASGGALSARGRKEFYFNRDTARTVKAVLEGAGAKVILMNDSGTLTTLWDRPRIALRLGADAFISIHHDSVNAKYIKTWTVDGRTRQYSDKFRGYSVFCSEKNWMADESKTLALEIGKAMKDAGFKPTPHHNEAIQGENRPYIDEATGVYEFTDLIVAKAGKLPSVLLECGVIVHREEELEVQKKEYKERIGEALVRALAAARAKGAVD